MPASIWILMLIVCIAGGMGGLINAMITDNGFPLPRPVVIDQISILRPGFLGNVLIGIVSALISWGLYGPFGSASMFSTPTPDAFTLSSLVGAMLVGMGGARWLSNEVDKKLLTLSASKAAAAPATPQAANAMLVATPAQSVDIAQHL